ncbi:MAG: HAMP domain-containing histidine kinase [Gammaproteobacteria bacterium]|nr:HAMP domain-containing histidine kinase [Gammaproteobacteria bacterium]
MWHNISIRSQLVILFALLLTFVEAGTLALAYWFDIKERRSLAIEQTRTLGRTLNHDLLKALLNQQASVYSDISFRLSGFDSVAALALLDGKDKVVYQYQQQQNMQSILDITHIETIPQFTGGFLLLRQPLKSDNYVFGSVIFKIDLAAYNTQLKEHLFVLLLIFPLELFVGLAIAWRISRAYTQPFTVLADAMKASDVQNNEYQYVSTRAKNEIADLYEGYNLLIRQIEKTTDGLRQAICHREQSDVANQAKSAFLANMSHELRTPLNAIIGYSEIIRENSLETHQSELVRDSENINVAGRHLLSLINSVLDLSKIEAGKMDVHLEPVSVKSVLYELVSTINPLVDKKHNRLTVEVKNGVDIITTDLTKLRQILINLVSNANKFTSNGEIKIEVWCAEYRDAGCCYFKIRDTGIGMSPETLKKLFTPFTQAEKYTTRDFGGTGLGLTISKRFCQLLGGDITVESELGKGSAFTVRLPAAQSDISNKDVEKRKAG